MGVAHGIAAADVFVYGACDDTGFCATDEVTAGINAGIFTAHVINMSLVQDYDAAQASAVAQAWANNIVLVAAAGNSQGQTERYPAKYTNVLGVSGVKEDKSFADSSPCGNSSNWGPHVDIAAPFTANSTLPTSAYGVNCGTSMATPHVSGAAALVRAKNPTWTNSQIVARLEATAEDRDTPGKDVKFGWGIVNAQKAVEPDPPAPPPPNVSLTGPTSVKPNVTCAWFANASGGTPPYNYAWTVGGLSVGGNSSELQYENQGYSFTVSVRVTDAAGGIKDVFKSVTVVSSAPTCFF